MAKRVDPQIETFARIKVIGIGGAGGAAVNRMIDAGVADVDFIAINTDAQALHHNKASTKVNIGPQTTRGLGAGGDPKIGQDAAQESTEEIKKVIADTDILFLTFGAGGGTGSGAAHVIAQIAREMDILTIAFVTKPFAFEVERRARNAEFAISNLEKHVDTIVVIPNDNLLKIIDTETPVEEAFKIADDVLRQGVQGITDLITVPGLINLDFADVKSIMQNAGQALMGIGRAGGENRAETAARQAINSPLLDISINGAKGVLFNVIGSKDMSMHEINAAATVITEAADQDVNVIFGASINPDLEGEIIITVIATGFSDYLTATMDDFKVQTSESKAKSTPDLTTPKISKQEDLPSLPTRKEKTSKKAESAAADKKVNKKPVETEPAVEDIVKDATDDFNNNKTIIDESADDKFGLWDDVPDDSDKKLDLNKPTFLRKLAKLRQERRERREQEAQEAQDDDQVTEDTKE